MTRLPAALAVLLLHQEADRTGDERYRVKVCTLRQWKRRGHLSRGRDYDPHEIVHYLDRRLASVAS